MVVPRGIYKHFKGGLYLVTDVAEHCDTRQEFVVYRPLYGEYGLTIRPAEEFTGRVKREKTETSEAYEGLRFRLIKEL
jgi:hypothetical protein